MVVVPELPPIVIVSAAPAAPPEESDPTYSFVLEQAVREVANNRPTPSKNTILRVVIGPWCLTCVKRYPLQ